MKIYVITQGCYSDYHICAVTEKREIAEIIRKKCSDKWDEAEIEEFDTDNYNKIDYNKSFFNIHMDNEENIVYIDEISSGYYFKSNEVVHYPNGHFGAVISANDEKHAKKIFADMVAKCKAEEEGI